MPIVLAEKLKPGFIYKKAFEARRHLYNSLTGSLFDRQVKYEIMTYLPDLLIRQDKMSMAHSIENRVPFLDNEVVSNSFSIPEELLIAKSGLRGFHSEKYLLKRITANIFGDSFAFRPKSGFGIPVREFLLNKRFFEYLQDKVLPGLLKRGIFNSDYISRSFMDIRKLNSVDLEVLWITISFEIWASIYLDNNLYNRN